MDPTMRLLPCLFFPDYSDSQETLLNLTNILNLVEETYLKIFFVVMYKLKPWKRFWKLLFHRKEFTVIRLILLNTKIRLDNTRFNSSDKYITC